MERRRVSQDELREGLQPASTGVGPLVQRDYWCVIRQCRFRPRELLSFVRRRFPQIPPKELARFEASSEEGAPLELGDELKIRIPGAGTVAVRVVDVGLNSFTVATLVGHPLAGRITFGAYLNARGDVVFHIRSRSRAASTLDRVGHLVAGDPMQTTTWTDFLDRLAHMTGDGVVGAIHEEESEVPEAVEREESPVSPTFTAQGD
jgi:hypothetical protein